MKKKLIDYQKQWKARRGNILKAPFHVPDAKEHVEKDVYVIDKKALQEMVVNLQFNKKDLEHYDTLNSDATFLKESCRTKALCNKLYDWLGYEMRFLVVCDAIAQYQSRPLEDAPPLPAGTAPAAAAGQNDDGDGAGDDDDGAGGAGGDGVGGAGGAAGDKRPDPHHFMAWDLAEVLSVPWNEMRFTEISDSSECYSFWPACIVFFYITELPEKLPEVDGALHKLWQRTYSSPMKAEDLDSTPIAFNDEETAWCKKTIEALQRGLTAEQRAERGLPPVRQQRQARTKQSQQLVQAAKRKRGQDDVPQGGAAEASDESDISPALKTPRRYVCVIFA